MNEKVEQVAKALWDVQTKPWSEVRFEDTDEENKDELRKEARAAIEAMREPTEAMLFVGSNEEAGFTAENLRGSWRLMCDEALKP